MIGAGRLGYHLGTALSNNGLDIKQVFSRRMEKAMRLAESTNSQALNRLEDVDGNSHLYILAVSDDAIGEVAEKLSRYISREKVVVHTSGACPSTVLEAHFANCGVFYPLQSFSEDRQPDFSKIPICFFSPKTEVEAYLCDIAGRISSKLFSINDNQRAILHVAAVFANNFTNHLYSVASQILREEQIPFELLLPLIEETAAKVSNHSPHDMQTGPARRGDQLTLQRHLNYLEKKPAFKQLYKLLTDSILDEY